MELLELLNPRYTKAIVLSCLQDLTPLVQYDLEADALLFHYASFSDYLLDQSRSQSYFIDTTAFIYRFPPVFWRLTDTLQFSNGTSCK